MSTYEHNKVIRCKVSPKDLCISDLDELSEIYPDLFDIGSKLNLFTIAPTTELLSTILYLMSIFQKQNMDFVEN